MIRGTLVLLLFAASSFPIAPFAQEKPLQKFRTGGGSASAAQMSIWFAKEGNFYEKNGLNVEVISIPGSSLAIQAALSGTDTLIVATIAKKFNWWIFSQPGINRIEDLRGKIFGTTRFGTQSDLASRIALRRAGIDPERDITMVQTGGPAETISAMVAGKVHAAAVTPPATLQARKAKLKDLVDLSKLDVEYHVNGVVTTRKFLKSNEDTVRRFLRAYIEGAVRGMKDKAFAMKSMGKYFRTDDHEVLEETYEMVIKNGFNVPPYPAGIQSLLLELEKTVPKAKSAKPEEFADSRLVKELDQSGFINSLLSAR